MDTPFTRQSSRDALRSSITEGSSRIFGSVMGAKRGLIGGLTSTFDQVVNIVGGGDDDDTAVAGRSAAGGGVKDAQQSPPTDGTAAAAATASGGGGVGVQPPKSKPPKPPAPMSRQRSDLNVNNGSVKQFAADGNPEMTTGSSNRMSRHSTVPVGGPATTSRGVQDQTSDKSGTGKCFEARMANKHAHRFCFQSCHVTGSVITICYNLIRNVRPVLSSAALLSVFPSEDVCACVFVCMCVYVYVFVCLCVCVYVCVPAYVFKRTPTIILNQFLELTN